MSTDHISQNIQVEEILKQSLHELRWGDYYDMERVDVFEVWTIRADSEIDRIGTYIEYIEAVSSAQRIMQASAVPLTRAVVVWIFRDEEEGSVLEVGIAKRKG